MEKLQKQNLVERLRAALMETLADQPVLVAYLYGSQASGLATSSSDIDIALLAAGEPSMEEQLRIERKVQEEIYRRCGLENVDVRFLNNRSLLFQGRALTHQVLLYCRNDHARVAYETRVRDLYFDFLPVAERHRKVFFERLRQEGFAHGRQGRS